MSTVNGEEDYTCKKDNKNERIQVLLTQESASTVLDELGDLRHVLEHLARVLLVVISLLKAIELEVVVTSAAVSVLRDVHSHNFLDVVDTEKDGNKSTDDDYCLLGL